MYNPMKKIQSKVFAGELVSPRQELKWMLERAGVTLEQVEEINKIQNLIKQQTNNLAIQKFRKQENLEPLNELSITIYWSENEMGYMYDIWDQDLPEGGDRPEDSIDGGCCTGRLIDALGMATDQAENFINMLNN